MMRILGAVLTRLQRNLFDCQAAARGWAREPQDIPPLGQRDLDRLRLLPFSDSLGHGGFNGHLGVVHCEHDLLVRLHRPHLRGERILAGLLQSTAGMVSVAGVPTWFPATNKQEFFTTRRLLIERVNRVE